MTTPFEHTAAGLKYNPPVKLAEELLAFGQGNVAAFVKSGQIWATGVENLSRSLASSAQAQLREARASAKAATSAKSVKELLDLQAAFARASLEKTLAETTKLTDALRKLAEDTAAPITARVVLATETFGRGA